MDRKKAVAELNQSLYALVQEFERLQLVIGREHGLGVTEMRGLGCIAEGERVTPKVLAAELQLTTGAVTALADRLVDAGLVARQPHPDDRRSLLLATTAQGSETISRIASAYEAVVRDGTIGLGVGRLTEAAEVLDGLVAHTRSTFAR